VAAADATMRLARPLDRDKTNTAGGTAYGGERPGAGRPRRG